MKKKHSQLYYLAHGLSWVFQPPLMIPLVIWVVTSQIEKISRLLAMEIVTLGYVILPAVFFISWFRKGKMSDVEITKKEERNRVYAIVLLFHFLSMLVFAFWGEWMLVKSLLGLFVCGAVFAVINLYSKISVHTGMMAVAIITLNYFWGYRLFGWMFFFLVALMWGRVYLRRHSLGQVTMGVLVPYAVLELVWRVLGV